MVWRVPARRRKPETTRSPSAHSPSPGSQSAAPLAAPGPRPTLPSEEGVVSSHARHIDSAPAIVGPTAADHALDFLGETIVHGQLLARLNQIGRASCRE